MRASERLSDILDVVLDLAKTLPNPPREMILRRIAEMKEFMMEARPPKIVVVGRRGAGKSSLINAFFGKQVAAVGSVMSETGAPTWHTYKDDNGSLEVLDTRGLGDNSQPESANFQNSLDEIKSAITPMCPDAVLFLCKAKEVDSRISEDVVNVTDIREFVRKTHQYDIPVVSAVTQVDELDPKRVERPYEDTTKQANITAAVEAVSKAFDSRGIGILKVIPVSAYAEYDNGDRAYDNYWNIDSLVEYLANALPRSAQVEFARLTRIKRIQKKMARVLVGSTAVICGGLAATPIPIADILPITTAQIGMIVGIGYISGRPLSRDTAKSFLVALGVNVGAAFALREVARGLLKIFLPGAGHAISAGVAFGGTWGIGEAAIAYYIEKKPIEEAKERLRSVRESRRKKLEERLNKLEERMKKGEISASEYEKLRQRTIEDSSVENL